MFYHITLFVTSFFTSFQLFLTSLSLFVDFLFSLVCDILSLFSQVRDFISLVSHFLQLFSRICITFFTSSCLVFTSLSLFYLVCDFLSSNFTLLCPLCRDSFHLNFQFCFFFPLLFYFLSTKLKLSCLFYISLCHFVR